MVHPDLSTDPVRVTRKALEVWKERGWKEQEAEGFVTPRWLQATEDEEE